MILANLTHRNIILGSGSPRRKELLNGLPIQFTVKSKDVDESYDPSLQREEVARFLSELKANAFENELKPDDLLITSDTTVCLGHEILNKPKDKVEAKLMLQKLSGETHTVISAVTITDLEKCVTFHDETKVTFKPLDEEEIDFYIEKHAPFDKAGSYGAQEFMGYIGIEKLSGSYFNVMGLPVHKVYEELKHW
ncbi:MAG: Maf family nucleotide pyrophosphatase [Flavobacteriales bacterium]